MQHHSLPCTPSVRTWNLHVCSFHWRGKANHSTHDIHTLHTHLFSTLSVSDTRHRDKCSTRLDVTKDTTESPKLNSGSSRGLQVRKPNSKSFRSNMKYLKRSTQLYGLPHSSVGKESACNAGDPSSIPGSGRSPGVGNGNSLQYSCLDNPIDRGAWRATVHRVSRVEHNLATKPTTMQLYGYLHACYFSNHLNAKPLLHNHIKELDSI